MLFTGKFLVLELPNLRDWILEKKSGSLPVFFCSLTAAVNNILLDPT